MYEILMKRKSIDKVFRPCPAFSTDQPEKDRCTFNTRREAENHLKELAARHGAGAEFRLREAGK